MKGMRPYIVIIILFFSISSSAQTDWNNYAAVETVKEVEVYDNKAYVSNNAGLLIIDLDTGEEELLMPANSTFEGFCQEIEIMSNGDAWVASSYGLMYYDGDNFELFEGPDTINFIRPKNLRIHNDELWFLDFHEKVYSIKDMILTEHSAVLPENIKYLDLDSEGNVWVLTIDDGFKYDGNNILSTFEIYPGDEVWQLDEFYIDSNDGLWMPVRPISTGDLELAYIDAQGWHIVKTHYRIRSFFEHDSYGVCFVNLDDFGYIDNDTLGHVDFDTIFPNLPVDEYDRTKFQKWDNNEAWFSGTHLDEPMIHRYVGNEIQQYAHNTVFLGDVSDIEVDCEDVLFKASESFIEKFEENQWDVLYPDFSDENCKIESLEMNPFTCELWGYSLAYPSDECHSIWKINNDELTEFDILDSAISDIAFAPDGKTYFIGESTLSYIDTLGTIYSVDIDFPFPLTEVFISSQGMIWVLGQDFSNFPNSIDDVFFVSTGNGEWTEYATDITQISTGGKCHIVEDNNGDLWFSSLNNLIKYDGIDWTSYPLEFNFQSFNEFLIDEFGNFWIASYDDGLVYWDTENFTYYNIENTDIFSNRCYGLKRVGNDLWIEHDIGLSQMELAVVSATEPQSVLSPALPFTLFPNPTQGRFHVQSDNTIEKKYDVYSLTGTLLLSEISSKEVWSSTLKSGVYLVKVTTKKGEFVEKLIVL